MMATSPHVRIAIDQAGAGMVLADDLLDSQGAVLLPQGVTLTDATLAGLRRRGVGHCTIVGAAPGHDDGADGGAAARAALRERQLARLGHLFRHTADQEANATLLQLLTDYRNRE
jgi:hypothetical protein